MENYQTQNTPFWQHHPTDCRNVVIRKVTVNSIGPNNDGFDPDACDHVLCEDVVFTVTLLAPPLPGKAYQTWVPSVPGSANTC